MEKAVAVAIRANTTFPSLPLMINSVDGEVDIPKPRELSEYNVPERAGKLAIPAWSAFSALYMQSLRKLADDYPRFMNGGVVVTAAPSSSTSPTRPPRTSRGTTKFHLPATRPPKLAMQTRR
jgi:hypothetical protein